ncbi:MAG: phosphatidylglycerol lysyltransferase domain-containing protein [Methylomonas sp.]
MLLDYENSSYLDREAKALNHETNLPSPFDSRLSSDIDLVRRYGGPVSHAALNPSHRTFRSPGIDGMVGFLLAQGCAVALGDPMCAPEQRDELTAAFAKYCADNKWSVIYAVATSNLRSFVNESGGGMLEFADLLVANPQHDPEAGSKGRHLRWNLNRARRHDVKVHEYQGNRSPDAELEARAMEALGSWRAGRKGFQMYLGSPRLFADRPGCRWFIAECAGSVVGVLYMMQVNCAGCRYLIDLVFSTPDAPQHTNELMVVSAFKALREEGEVAVCLGVGPKALLGEVRGFGTLSSALARSFYKISNKMVPQHGKTVFWEKFGIVHREPLYLIFQHPRVGIREFHALLKTFNFSMSDLLR